jgi:hypothetical protein
MVNTAIKSYDAVHKKLFAAMKKKWYFKVIIRSSWNYLSR